MSTFAYLYLYFYPTCRSIFTFQYLYIYPVCLHIYPTCTSTFTSICTFLYATCILSAPLHVLYPVRTSTCTTFTVHVPHSTYNSTLFCKFCFTLFLFLNHKCINLVILIIITGDFTLEIFLKFLFEIFF